MIPVLLPIVATALALLAEEVVTGAAPRPRSAADVLAAVRRLWESAGGKPLDAGALAELESLLQQAWATAGQQWPVKTAWAELVADPFAERRAQIDLAVAWPEAVAAEGSVVPLPVPPVIEATRVPPGQMRFSDVRRAPDDRWFADLGENPQMAGAKSGDWVPDAVSMARTPRPYWVVSAVEGNIVWLDPVGWNPLVTGVGAGGKPIDEHDLLVLSGGYEEQATRRAAQTLRDGTATINSVKYLLAGTCPVNFGPNGAQGGWYNAHDTMMNRGGRTGMTAEQIMVHDARTLVGWGLVAPTGALQNDLPVDVWIRWVEGPETDMDRATCPDPVAWLAFAREMTRKRFYRYDRARLAEEAHHMDRAALKRYLDRVIRDFVREPAFWQRTNPYLPRTLLELVEWGMRCLKRQAAAIARQRSLDIPGEDSSDPASIRRHLHHPERRVSVRNAVLAVHRAALETVRPEKFAGWRTTLLDWMRWGKSDWLGYEQAIKHFALLEDIEALHVAVSLPDPTNRHYALSPLVRLDPEGARPRVLAEEHPEALYRALYEWRERHGPASTWMLVSEARLVDRLYALPADLGWDSYHWRELTMLVWRQAEVAGDFAAAGWMRDLARARGWLSR